MWVFVLCLAVSVTGQIQVPTGRIPSPPQLPQPAAFHGLPQTAPSFNPAPTQSGGPRRSENLFLSTGHYDPFFSTSTFINTGYQTAAGYPGFYGGFGVSPQQNGDGTWSFVALPIPTENQTLPEGFPSDKVAQAKLWGPVYKEGQGWVYGEAGMILVPKYPPYAPPGYVTPAALQPPPSPPTTPAPAADEKAPLAEGTVAVDTKSGKPLTESKSQNSKVKSERLRKRKEPR